MRACVCVVVLYVFVASIFSRVEPLPIVSLSIPVLPVPSLLPRVSSRTRFVCAVRQLSHIIRRVGPHGQSVLSQQPGLKYRALTHGYAGNVNQRSGSEVVGALTEVSNIVLVFGFTNVLKCLCAVAKL